MSAEKPMRGGELGAVLDELGLTLRGFSRQLGCSIWLVSEWRHDRQPVPNSIARVARGKLAAMRAIPWPKGTPGPGGAGQANSWAWPD